MDYATYIRVKAEMAAHRRFMHEREFPNEANDWHIEPNLLQRLGTNVTTVLRSAQHRKPADGAATTADKKLRTASSR